MELIFWILAFMVVYVYLLYPLFVGIPGMMKKSAPAPDPDITPSVSLIITAYNEENVIREKLENSLLLDYPEGKLEIMVVSDGSTDNTENIVKEYADKGVKLYSEKRAGKTTAQNNTVGKAGGEIVVFSDANGMYKKDAIKKLVRHFADETVGCVCGELLYSDSPENSAGVENLYWKYERFLKRMESRCGTQLGAAGSIYAVKKELYVPLDRDLISDFTEPLKIYEKGHRVVYEPESLSFEKTSSSTSAELRRKVRITTRGIHAVFAVKNLLNPLKHGFFSIQLISHKLLRWLVPILLILLFILNLLLIHKSLYCMLMLVQVLFYLLSLAGLITEKTKYDLKIFSIPFYFCMVNFAALIGWYNLLKGEKETTWDTSR